MHVKELRQLRSENHSIITEQSDESRNYTIARYMYLIDCDLLKYIQKCVLIVVIEQSSSPKSRDHLIIHEAFLERWHGMLQVLVERIMGKCRLRAKKRVSIVILPM